MKLTLRNQQARVLRQHEVERAASPRASEPRLERDTRIELASLAWEANVLPLYESRASHTLYQTLAGMQRFFVIAAIILSGALLLPHSAHAESSSIFIKLNVDAVKSGYTVVANGGNAKVGIQSNTVMVPVSVRLEPYPDSLPENPGLRRASDVWVFDVLKQGIAQPDPLVLTKPLWISLLHDQKTLFGKSIYYWDKAGAQWKKLPSSADVRTGAVRAAFPLPYAPVAVFDDQKIIEGRASWFRYKFPFGAASNDFPYGSKLRVTDLETKKSVVVTVKTTGPFVPGRVIDLASGAFKALRSLGQGVTVVRVELLSTP